jgi:uncharacterized phage protein (TIGR02216 family)
VERFSDAAGWLAGCAGALLGWRPDEFWRSTPAELGAVLRALAGDEQAVSARADFADLMEMFPDG